MTDNFHVPDIRSDSPLGQTITSLLDEAQAADRSERRGEVRHPLFRPLSLSPVREPQRQFSAFSREISRTGIGLLHNMSLEPGEVLLTILRDGGSTLKIRTEIVWCRACDEGWYLSGGRFLDPPAIR